MAYVHSLLSVTVPTKAIPMQRFRPILISFVLLTALAISTAHAQQPTAFVSFVVDTKLGTASLTDPGRHGLNRLGEIFQSLGARVNYIDLRKPIPENTQLLVLVHPIKTLTVVEAARLWLFLHDGKNVLLAFDPERQYIGDTNLAPQILRSGLTKLIATDFGIAIRDAMLIEPWFTQESIMNLDATNSRTFADVVTNPITAPLAAYHLPVWVWGARNLTVDPIGIDNTAVPLLYNNDGYGEASPDVFRVVQGQRFIAPKAPLGVNIGTDYLGWLNFAAIGTNSATGSRIAVLGDSEMLMNGYGLAGSANEPRYVGNQIFAQRLAAWLLELPPASWPPLPDGFTWIAVDGRAADWAGFATESITVNPVSTASPEPALEIKSIQSFQDDLFVYLLVQTAAQPRSDTDVMIQLDDNGDGSADESIRTQPGNKLVLRAANGHETQIVDGEFAVRDVVELRIPLRIASSMIGLCLQEGMLSDCTAQPIPHPQARTHAPFDLGLANGPIATVQGSFVNLRSSPSINARIVTSIPSGTVLGAISRNEEATWIFAQNAAYAGWIQSGLVLLNGDLMSLPVQK